MKNRILSIILTFIMLVSVVSVFVVPASAANVASDFAIQPIVLLGGDDEYNIVWKNNFAGKGYVTYTYNGKAYTVWDEENGVVRGNDYMHTVRVPQAHIHQNRSYTIHATNGSTNFEFPVTGFNGLGDGTLDIGFVSDVHFRRGSENNNTDLNAMLEEVEDVFQTDLKTSRGNSPELRVLLGDITDSLGNEEVLNGLYKILAKAGCDGAGNPGHYPVLYAVGNHEKRGAYTHDIDKYLSYNTGEFYGYFEFGDAAFYVSDIGEDKVDSSPEYTPSAEDTLGLIDMQRYYAEQYQYFNSHKGYNTDKTYTFTMSHAPSFVGYNYSSAPSADFKTLFNKYGTDLHLFGHWHEQTFYDGVNTPTSDYDKTTHESTKLENGTMSAVTDWTAAFPGVNVGASGYYTASERGVLMTLSNGTYTIKAMNEDGVTANWTATVDAAANGAPAVKEEVEEVLPEDEETGIEADNTAASVPTASGTSTAALKSASATTAITTAPVVFDAGLYYNIVWQTADKAAGYVDVTGASKSYMDYYGGVLRHTKRETTKIHSVRIPKAKLDGKTFSVKSRSITSDYICGYGKYVTDDETGERVIETYQNALTFGAYNWSGATDFVDQPSGSDDKYTVVAVGGDADFAAVKASLTEVPNLVVITGNVVDALNTEADFAALLTKLHTLTGGNSPVMLLRGEGEITGDYAAELPTVLHNFSSADAINKMYVSSKTGALSVIGLDTPVEALRDEQADWLANDLTSTFAGRYNLAFANAENDAMAANFANHNVQLSVVAGATTALTNGGSSYSTATVAANDALVITCADGEVDVVSVNNGALETLKTSEVVNAEAKIGNTYYKTLADAIANAVEDDTIVLTSDVTAKNVRVRAGITLDINGKKLTATSVTGFDDSNIIDSNVTETSGIYVARNRLTVAENNAELPIYDTANGCYMFTTVDLSYTYYDDAYSSYYFGPELPAFSTVEGERANALLRQNSANTGVQIIVHLDWETKDYFSSQDFNYKPNYLEQYFSMAKDDGHYYNVYFYAAFSGDVLKQADSVTVTTLVKSDRGYSIASASTTFSY